MASEAVARWLDHSRPRGSVACQLKQSAAPCYRYEVTKDELSHPCFIARQTRQTPYIGRHRWFASSTSRVSSDLDIWKWHDYFNLKPQGHYHQLLEDVEDWSVQKTDSFVVPLRG